MWRQPYRPRENSISHSYNDGLVDIYRQTDSAKPGYAPRPALHLVGTLAYSELRLGIQRYYAGRQNQLQIEKVLRVQQGFLITSQMVAVIRGDPIQYRIDLVQRAEDVYPASWDLTLTRVTQVLPVEGGGGSDVV